MTVIQHFEPVLELEIIRYGHMGRGRVELQRIFSACRALRVEAIEEPLPRLHCCFLVLHRRRHELIQVPLNDVEKNVRDASGIDNFRKNAQ